jgi:RES domain-containing protein
VRITAWRIVLPRHAADAFSGEGARRYPGRWNQRGTPMVYAAGSLSLAAMEMLVHLGRADVLQQYFCMPVLFDKRLCRDLPLAGLPSGWRDHPVPRSTRQIGTDWCRSRRSLVLRVPSATVLGEMNYIINPQHPDAGRLDIGRPEPFSYDPRLAQHR